MEHIDDWRAETQNRLRDSIIFRTLKAKCDDDPSGIQVLELVDSATFYAFQRTKIILRHMGEFTLHDGDHLFRVLALMERIIGGDQVQYLEIPELMLLILACFFHDIGMAPSETEVLAWKKVWDHSPTFDSKDEKSEYEGFQKYFMARPDQKQQIEKFIVDGDISSADLNKNYLIADYIRVTHAERASKIIGSDWLGKIRYRDIDLTIDFARVCFSHNENPLTLFDLESQILCGPNTYANLQLVSLVLRLADLLDFDAKRTPTILYSHLFVRHPVSLVEWSKHRAVESWKIDSSLIQFHAKCKHPAIESAIHSFCDVIDNELSACNKIAAKINEQNKADKRDLVLEIPFTVDRSKITTQTDVYGKPKYIFKETQFSLSKKQVIDLLMGTKLYGNPEVALRELIQNSIDACLLREALETMWGNLYVPEISIKFYTKDNDQILEVIDNGIGMDQSIIDSYYSKVGSSFYKSPDFYSLRAESGAEFTPTSRFGIGILSCFMVADTLEVDTRKIYGPHNSSDPISLMVEGQESIFWIRPGERATPGTSTKLVLRAGGNPWQNLSDAEFISSVTNVVPNPPFKLKIVTETEECMKDSSSFKDESSSLLADYTWAPQESIRQIELEFKDKSKGFMGSATVAILEAHGQPVSHIEMDAKTIEIDGKTFDLEKNLSANGNEINLSTTSITIDEEGSIERSETYNTRCKSMSKLSLHGIEVPSTLFPERWRQSISSVKLDWPFPSLLVLDICGNSRFRFKLI